MEDKSRLDQQIDFCRIIDKEKFIGRQTYLSDGVRKENDAEHAWHMATMAILLSEYANEPIDLLKTVTMILMHDVVEVEAGDTYAYDASGKASQREREEQAADHLYGMLPEDQRKKYRDLWEEFEACETPEARFARAMDNFQPMMLNHLTEGRSWKEHEVKISQILKRNEITPKGSNALWEYALDEFLKPNMKAGRIIDDKGIMTEE